MIKVRIFLTDYEIEELSFFASSESIGKLHAIATAKIKEYCASKDWRYNPHAWDVKVTVPTKPIGDTPMTWPIAIGILLTLAMILSVAITCLISK